MSVQGFESRISSIQRSHQLVYLSRSDAISKFQVYRLYNFLPLTTRNFLEIWSYNQCLQDIFIFRNLTIHIVYRHYVHMTHVKFLQETNQMISTGRDLIFLIYLDKYQLGFTLSYVRVSDSRTSHIFQDLSCL